MTQARAFARRQPEGLYDPAFDHDACGVAFVANLTAEPSHQIVAKGLEALRNLDHRGATGSDPKTGDGAGMLLQIPDAFLRADVDFELPRPGAYAVGNAFLPTDPDLAAKAKVTIEQIAAEEHLSVLGWRRVRTDDASLSDVTRSNMPYFEQLFVTAKDAPLMGIALDRLAYCLRRRTQHETGVYFASLSARTIVYKGMLTTEQLPLVYPELLDERMASALVVVHSRFSTNTFPAWELAHPFRMIAHNGEINTVMGNRNWMRAREALLASDVIPGDLERLFPICTPDDSDSASFDEVVELLHLGGRSLPHALLMMIPEAWENNPAMDPKRRDFYAFHSCLMEPWDGPASITFTDGTLVGAVLDRNGLRPGRYWVTDDGLVVLASEAGVLDIDPATVVQKGRLQPGRMFLVDLAQHRIISDEEVKSGLAAAEPYGEWLLAGRMLLSDLPEREHVVHTHASVTRRQQVFGYTEEELRLILAPMASGGAEPIGSMGTDTPLAALSDKPRLLFDYFSQLFAQVTNPPLDAIREELVTSLYNTIGQERNLLEPTAGSCRRLVLPFPVLDNDALAKIVRINREGDLPGYQTYIARGLYDVTGGAAALTAKLDELCAEISDAIEGGARIIVLSDRHSNAELAPIPSLLFTAAVHHHLVREKSRTQVGLVVEAGDVREVHHVALLIGYGAAAVNPYLAIESVEDLARHGVYTSVEPEQAVTNVIKALGKGVLKVMSKMGVSTVASYTGAQIFEALGLSREVVDRYFTGTTSKLGGVTLEQIAAEVHQRHLTAYPADGIPLAHRLLPVGGEYQWRREGEPHLFDPETVFRLQHSTRSGRYDIFKQYTNHIDTQSERLMTLRGLLKFASDRPPVPIEEVEPVSEIVKRFATGAMSYGSISAEAHETLAIAMNRIGGKSNTGEGGEDKDRLYDPERRSAVKQVASGRFGVTSDYLTNASDLQIKMAQGAKPGEGGQLPGPEGLPVDRDHPALHARGRADLAAAAPRHLLDRGPQAADPRPEVRQSERPGARQAGGRGRGRHGGRRGVQGQGGRGADLRPRRRHRCGAAHLAQARRRTVGAGSGRDPADLVDQRPAGPDRGPGRRAAEDRPGRDHRRAARGGGVRLRHRAAGGLRLHHDAGVPPGHLSGRRGHSEPRAAEEIYRQAGVRGEFLRVHRGGGAGAPGRAGLPHAGRGDRARRGAGHHECRAALEGPRPGPEADPAHARGADRTPRGTTSPARTTGWTKALDQELIEICQPALTEPRSGAGVAEDPQRSPHRRHHPRSRGDQGDPGRGAAGRHHRHHLRGLGRTELRRLSARRDHPPAGGGQQRLPGQGPVRRPDRAPARRVRRPSWRRTTSSPAT